MDERYSAAWVDLGSLYESFRQFNEALFCYKKALKYNPGKLFLNYSNSPLIVLIFWPCRFGYYIHFSSSIYISVYLLIYISLLLFARFMDLFAFYANEIDFFILQFLHFVQTHLKRWKPVYRLSKKNWNPFENLVHCQYPLWILKCSFRSILPTLFWHHFRKRVINFINLDFKTLWRLEFTLVLLSYWICLLSLSLKNILFAAWNSNTSAPALAWN